MKILVAPLNWGLGHATRCVPLIQSLLDAGNEVVLGGDGESLTLLRHHFPTLRYVYLAPLNLRYSKRASQVGAMVRALPQLVRFVIEDHLRLKALLLAEAFDQIISDNRFGLYKVRQGNFVYITHQLHIHLPKGWTWLAPIADRVHAMCYRRYDEVWIPDTAEYATSLAGDLSHPSSFKYIGALSRLRKGSTRKVGDVALLSGLEPQRTMLEKTILATYEASGKPLLLIRGKVNEPPTKMVHGAITMVNHLDDVTLAEVLLGAEKIIARSGYSTIMDLAALDVLDKAEFYPTPGQPEQEYLAQWMQKRLIK